MKPLGTLYLCLAVDLCQREKVVGSWLGLNCLVAFWRNFYLVCFDFCGTAGRFAAGKLFLICTYWRFGLCHVFVVCATVAEKKQQYFQSPHLWICVVTRLFCCMETDLVWRYEAVFDSISCLCFCSWWDLNYTFLLLYYDKFKWWDQCCVQSF